MDCQTPLPRDICPGHYANYQTERSSDANGWWDWVCRALRERLSSMQRNRSLRQPRLVLPCWPAVKKTAQRAVHFLVVASLLVPNLGAFAASDPGGPLPNADINASALLLTSPSDSGFLATASISQLGEAVESGHAVERDWAVSDGVSNGGGEANTPEEEVVEIDLTKDVEGLYWAPSGGLTDGTYFYPVSAAVQRESSGGFTFENGSAAAGVADEGVMRGHYGGGPGAARWILTLNFGGLVTSPGGDWMSSKTGASIRIRRSTPPPSTGKGS